MEMKVMDEMGFPCDFFFIEPPGLEKIHLAVGFV
jgi:hypothetical protein